MKASAAVAHPIAHPIFRCPAAIGRSTSHRFCRSSVCRHSCAPPLSLQWSDGDLAFSTERMPLDDVTTLLDGDDVEAAGLRFEAVAGDELEGGAGDAAKRRVYIVGHYDSRNADLLFEVVRRRYEHKSILLTTNLDFGQWHTVFPSAASAVALIDRLIHHARIISIRGESYRKREAEAKQTTRRRKA